MPMWPDIEVSNHFIVIFSLDDYHLRDRNK